MKMKANIWRMLYTYTSRIYNPCKLKFTLISHLAKNCPRKWLYQAHKSEIFLKLRFLLKFCEVEIFILLSANAILDKTLNKWPRNIENKYFFMPSFGYIEHPHIPVISWHFTNSNSFPSRFNTFLAVPMSVFYPPVCLHVFMCSVMSVCRSACVFICKCACLSVSTFFYLSVCQSF